MSVHKLKLAPWLMWFLPLVFFSYQFILRLWPGLMMQSIMTQFSIDATQFGFISAVYYYGYAGMQIPVAFLLDRFGPRYIVCAFALLCGLATLLFTFTSNWYLACLSRFLVGAGSAVGFLGVSKVVSQWFPREQYTRMIGYSFTVGLLGAIYGGKPISLLIEHYSWQQVALALALLSLALGVTTFLVLRSPNKVEEAPNSEFKFSSFKSLLSNPSLWVLAVANLLMVGSLEGFSDVWGVPYLMKAYAIEKSAAAELISFVFVGMLFGGPILAGFSKKWGNYTVVSLCGMCMATLFTVILLMNTYNWWILAALFFAIGLLCCYQVIVFAAGAELVTVQVLGVTVAFLNCINMLGGSFFHTSIGYAMDFFWSGEWSTSGVKMYSLHAYQNALLVIPACAGLGAVMVMILGYQRIQSGLRAKLGAPGFRA